MSRLDRNQEYRDGVLVAEEVVEVDTTADEVALSLIDRLRQAVATHRAYLKAPVAATNAQRIADLQAQVARLTRHVIADTRLGPLADTLTDPTID